MVHHLRVIRNWYKKSSCYCRLRPGNVRRILLSHLFQSLKELVEEFWLSLKLAFRKPLVIILDSLDQFDPANGSRQLGWLPKQLPKNVKMIVSTLPEPQYECFQKLEVHSCLTVNQLILGR